MRPTQKKDQAPEVMAELLDGVSRAEATFKDQRVIFRVRSDSDPVFRSKSWKGVLGERGIVQVLPSPYLPQQNGVVERMMHAMGGCLRAILNGVDRSLWCYAVRYFGWTWNRVPKKKLQGCHVCVT